VRSIRFSTNLSGKPSDHRKVSALLWASQRFVTLATKSKHRHRLVFTTEIEVLCLRSSRTDSNNADVLFCTGAKRLQRSSSIISCTGWIIYLSAYLSPYIPPVRNLEDRNAKTGIVLTTYHHKSIGFEFAYRANYPPSASRPLVAFPLRLTMARKHAARPRPCGQAVSALGFA
jgi:hypothetical protein